MSELKEKNKKSRKLKRLEKELKEKFPEIIIDKELLRLV